MAITALAAGPELPPEISGLGTALAIGLLIGTLRERHGSGRHGVSAGIRTHAIVAIAAATASLLGPWLQLTALAAIAALTVASHLHTARHDAGLTGEVTLLATALLSMLALARPSLAAALGVLVALLVYAKQPLRRLARDQLSDAEIRDGLRLLAAAVVVLPLLPTTAIDPWGVLVPARLWRVVVLVMAVGMAGHVAMRSLGASWGLPLAGFFSGFASSTAAVAGFGQRSRQTSELSAACASAALLSNLASLLLLGAVIGSVAPALLSAVLPALVAGALALLAVAALGLRHARDASASAPPDGTRAFRLGPALALAGVIGALLLVSAWLRMLFGDAGALVATMIAALAEQHAAAASLAQLFNTGLAPETARWGLTGILASATAAKTVVAFSAGTKGYAAQVCGGMVAMVLAVAAVTAL